MRYSVAKFLQKSVEEFKNVHKVFHIDRIQISKQINKMFQAEHAYYTKHRLNKPDIAEEIIEGNPLYQAVAYKGISLEIKDTLDNNLITIIEKDITQDFQYIIEGQLYVDDINAVDILTTPLILTQIQINAHSCTS